MLVTFLRDVLGKRVEQIVEQLYRKPMFPNDFFQVAEKPRRWRGELGAVAVQFLQADLRWIAAFVGEVVGAAREPVDDLDRLAQPRGQKQRSDGEVLVMAHRHGRYNTLILCAKVAELADAPDLGSDAARHEGSSPSLRTNQDY